MKMMKAVLALMWVLTQGLLGAQETTTTLDVNLAYYFPTLRGYGQGAFSAPGYAKYDNPTPGAGEAEALGGSFGGPGLEGILTWRHTLPFLVAPGVLTEGNNLSLAAKGALTPISFVGTAEGVLTPLAILKFRAGASAGLGWTIAGLKGLGVNVDGKTDPESFRGQLLQAWGAGTFQFDFGALFPGEWTHVVTVADAKVLWQNYTGAAANQVWYWQADAGENLNGVKFHGTYFVGWQLPKGLPVALTGILTEQKFYLGDAAALSPMATGWGSDFVYWASGPMVNFALSETSSLTALLQFQAARKYTEATAFRQYVQERDYEAGTAEFYLFALAWTQKL